MAKKQQSNKSGFSITALVISLIALVATGLIVVVRGMAAMGIYHPDSTNSIVDFLFASNRGLFTSLGFIVLGIAIYFLVEPDKIRRFISGRQAKYGSNALIMSVAFISILVVINVLAFQNPKRLADATEDKSNTLAPETIQALKTLPDKVTATAFYTSTLPRDTATKLFDEFKANSNGKFSYRFVDPNTDPVAARQAGVTADGDIMLTMGGHKEIVSSASETELTKALIRLINPQARVVYFLTGHGEADIQGGGEISFAAASQTLESKSYTVKKLNLLTDNKIPDDALAVIIAGPQKPVSEGEVNLLKKFVDAGGSLVVMEDPVIVTQFGNSNDPLADYLAGDWGVTLDKDIVIDLRSQQPLDAYSAPLSSQHPITQNANFTVVMPQARSLSITAQPQGVIQTQLLLTGQNAWGEMNFTNVEGSQIKQDPNDVPGPVTTAVAAENPSTKGRVVVFGNSLFATDKYFNSNGNFYVFTNSVDWASEQENLINITPHTPITRTFTPPAQGWFIFILLGAVCLVPGFVVLLGISAWFARRKSG